MTSEPDSRSELVADLARERRELRTLVAVGAAATLAIAVLWAAGVFKGPLPAMAAVLTGMATLCAWICADVCRKALAMLDDTHVVSRDRVRPDAGHGPGA